MPKFKVMVRKTTGKDEHAIIQVSAPTPDKAKEKALERAGAGKVKFEKTTGPENAEYESVGEPKTAEQRRPRVRPISQEGRTSRDVTDPKEMKEIWESHSKQGGTMSYESLEEAFSLRPANGMNAYRVCRKHEREEAKKGKTVKASKKVIKKSKKKAVKKKAAKKAKKKSEKKKVVKKKAKQTKKKKEITKNKTKKKARATTKKKKKKAKKLPKQKRIEALIKAVWAEARKRSDHVIYAKLQNDVAVLYKELLGKDPS